MRRRKDLLSQQQLYPVGQGRKPEAVASRVRAIMFLSA